VKSSGYYVRAFLKVVDMDIKRFSSQGSYADGLKLYSHCLAAMLLF
jgi:hypothetical protein